MQHKHNIFTKWFIYTQWDAVVPSVNVISDAHADNPLSLQDVGVAGSHIDPYL